MTSVEGRDLASTRLRSEDGAFPADLWTEGVGFEPTDRHSRSAVFKTAAFDHSATPPAVARMVVGRRPATIVGMEARHPASEGFANVAREYESGRPDYAPAALAWLLDRAELAAGARVVDVAAGTGKLTVALAGLGLAVTAVEPVPAMRAVLAERLPGAIALDGTAQALPLADGCADAVTVAQAYHWFAGDAALREFERVLAPGGTLALIWNSRDHSQPLWAAVDELFDANRGSAPRHDSGAWRASLTGSRFAALDEARFPNAQPTGHAAVLDRFASTSFIGALEPSARARLLDQVRALVAGEPEPVTLRYTTEVYLFRPAGR